MRVAGGFALPVGWTIIALMCIALPTGSRENKRPSRVPGFLRVALGGILLLGILLGSLILERLTRGRAAPRTGDLRTG